MNTSFHIAIIGCGRAGTSLALTFADAGFGVACVDGASGATARIAARIPDVETFSSLDDFVRPAIPVFWYICVPDQYAGDVVRHLADPSTGVWKPGDICVTASAAAPVIVTDPAPPLCGGFGNDTPGEPESPSEQDGLAMFRCGRAHPLFPFPPADMTRALPPGTAFALSSADAATAAVIRAAGGTTFQLDDRHATLYHAAAVTVSNLPAALFEMAASNFRTVGVPCPESSALRLLEGLVDNLRLGGLAAVSGPASRNDNETIAADQDALDMHDPQTAAAHRILSAYLISALQSRNGDRTG